MGQAGIDLFVILVCLFALIFTPLAVQFAARYDLSVEPATAGSTFLSSNSTSTSVASS